MRVYNRIDPVVRFWRYVQKSDVPGDCWLWTGAKQRSGHGIFAKSREARSGKAHRFSWELANGPIPSGKIVRHTCDNPPCVNPAHLEVGTQLDNIADMVARGRSCKGDRNPSRTHRHLMRRGRRGPNALIRGERHGSAKLTDAQVAEIRSKYKPGVVTYKMLAKEYGVHAVHIGNLVRGNCRNPKGWICDTDSSLAPRDGGLHRHSLACRATLAPARIHQGTPTVGRGEA